jgi:hypothetical protein
MLQQPTEPGFTADVGHRNDILGLSFSLAFGKLDEFVFQTVVGPFRVIMIHGLLEPEIQVPLTEAIEVIKNFTLQRLDEPFDVGHNIRRTDRRLLDFGTRVREFGVEPGRELAVAIMHKNLNTQLSRDANYAVQSLVFALVACDSERVAGCRDLCRQVPLRSSGSSRAGSALGPVFAANDRKKSPRAEVIPAHGFCRVCGFGKVGCSGGSSCSVCSEPFAWSHHLLLACGWIP